MFNESIPTADDKFASDDGIKDLVTSVTNEIISKGVTPPTDPKDANAQETFKEMLSSHLQDVIPTIRDMIMNSSTTSQDQELVAQVNVDSSTVSPGSLPQTGYGSAAKPDWFER